MADLGPIEGKTKIILPAGDDNDAVVEIVSKDDITAGDGAKRETIDGKDVYANVTTVNVFKLFKKHGIPNHYVAQRSPNSFLAIRMDMIPVEIVIRRIATGSYLKRHPDVQDSVVFRDLVVEFFEKDDANHDPLLVVIPDNRVLRYRPNVPKSVGFISAVVYDDSPLAGISASEYMQLQDFGLAAFGVLEREWRKQGVTLVDMKIECGRNPLNGLLYVADVVDNDSWRIWEGGTKAGELSKQRFRDLVNNTEDRAVVEEGLKGIRDLYARVCQMTDAFAE